MREPHVLEKYERNTRIYTQYMLGYTYAELGKKFDVHPSTIKQVVKRHEQRRRSAGELYGEQWTYAMARAAFAAGLEPLELR